MNHINQKLEQAVHSCLQKHKLTNTSQCLIIAFSGGIDSLCLLNVLSELQSGYNYKLIAVHINHNWRGEESSREELNAKAYCIKKSIKFYSKKLPENLPQNELTAREERYKFLNEIAIQEKATAIITGHTQSDQVETVLYRIIKGTGITGLTGIPEVRVQDNKISIYRPLLGITREETTLYCKENNLNPNIDSSNFEEKYFRNKIRHNLIPELKTYNNSIENSILKLSKIAEETESIVNETVYNAEKATIIDKKIITDKFLEFSEAIQKRIILNFLKNNELDYSFEKVDEIIKFIHENSLFKSGNTLSLTENLWLFASKHEIKVINAIKAQKLEEVTELEEDKKTVWNGLSFILEKFNGETPKSFPKETDYQAYISLNKLSHPIYIRTRKEGDKIQPFGMKEKTKLKKYFINKGIPEHIRDEIPLLATKTEIIWVIGVGISELLRVEHKPSHIIKVNKYF